MPPSIACTVSTLISLPGMHNTYVMLLMPSPSTLSMARKLKSCGMGLTNHIGPVYIT